MITSADQFRVLEEFNTQKRCLTAIALLSDVIFFSLKSRKLLTEHEGRYNLKTYRAKKLSPGTVSERVAVVYSASTTPDGASKDPKFVRMVRGMLAEFKCFKVLSGKSSSKKSPPCLYAGIDIGQCLTLFQLLYAQFEALRVDAEECGRVVLEMPKHCFTCIRQIFKSFFSFACSRLTVLSQELNNSQEQREFEAEERRLNYLKRLTTQERCLTAEIEQGMRFGLFVGGMQQELAEIQAQLTILMGAL